MAFRFQESVRANTVTGQEVEKTPPDTSGLTDLQAVSSQDCVLKQSAVCPAFTHMQTSLFHKNTSFINLKYTNEMFNILKQELYLKGHEEPV